MKEKFHHFETIEDAKHFENLYDDEQLVAIKRLFGEDVKKVVVSQINSADKFMQVELWYEKDFE